jgi:hypothetical protein
MADTKPEIRITAKDNRNALYVIMTEIIIVLVPFIITGIVFTSQGKFLKILSKEEWSLAASILSGQAMVKLVSGFLSSTRYGRPAHDKVILWIVLIMVVCFIPSLVILVLIMTNDPPPFYLVLSQILMFVLGISVFLIAGWVGQRLMTIERK